MNLIEILKVIVLGMVEGFTEWLPISSTGHLILVDEIIRLNVSEEFMEMFRVVIQLGAILAVVLLYFEKLNPFSRKKSPAKRKATLRLWFCIIIACVPAGILGILLNDWMDAHFYNGFVVALMLIIYGIIFIVVENRNRYKQPTIMKTGRISAQTAFYIGMFQVLALIPGTSRSGATIIGAMLLGCSRAAAAEFSFFLGIPVMCGASLVKILKFGLHFTAAEFVYLVLGFIVAFLVSVYSIRFLLTWIRKNDFKFFGWYRIVLGAIVLIWYIVSSFLK